MLKTCKITCAVLQASAFHSNLTLTTLLILPHLDVACKLGHVADHALHMQLPKLSSLLVGLPGETERPFNPPRLLLGAFIVLSHFVVKINLGKFSPRGYTLRKYHFHQGNLVFTYVKLVCITTANRTQSL